MRALTVSWMGKHLHPSFHSFWNSAPDDELFSLAADDSLLDEEVYRDSSTGYRKTNDRRGVRHFFDEVLEFTSLMKVKDPHFHACQPPVNDSAREETCHF